MTLGLPHLIHGARSTQPDNLLLCSEKGLLRVKIADFGFAKLARQNEYLVSNVGTVAYRGACACDGLVRPPREEGGARQPV